MASPLSGCRLPNKKPLAEVHAPHTKKVFGFFHPPDLITVPEKAALIIIIVSRFFDVDKIPVLVGGFADFGKFLSISKTDCLVYSIAKNIVWVMRVISH